MIMLQCYNRGCGKKYDPDANNDESCQHHPGAPCFHDAYKGWSCCNKKSVDFTEFLSIKGCTRSKHSNVKPMEPEKQAKVRNCFSEDVDNIKAPIIKALERPSFSLPMKKIASTVASALKIEVDKLKNTVPASKSESEYNTREIAIGTSCNNAGCTNSYTGTRIDDNECIFHPGVPIFHEGMKYWSCCQRKTSDFTVFMAQKGCIFGQHKWLKGGNNQIVQCRYDWHQTASDIIVSIYAKLYDYEQSIVEVNPIRLHVKLVFPTHDNSIFELDLELRGIIDVNKAAVNMSCSKLEIKLPKAEPVLWPKLDFPTTALPSLTTPTQQTSMIKSKNQNRGESDDDFNLDDIETVNPQTSLNERCQNNKNENI